MAQIQIYHNPRCRKSREALAILEENQADFEIIEYLKDTPSEAELKAVLKKLGIPAQELLRKGEDVYKEQYKGKELSEDEWIAAMVANPKLIERPIIIKGDKAVVARPPELAKEML